MNKSQHKINLVLLTDCLGNITGGAEKQIFELSKRLPKDQYNVFVVSMEATGNTPEDLIRSIDCQLKIFRVIRIYGLSGLIQGFKFFSFLRQNSIDTIVTYHFGSDIWGTFWGHLAGVRSIMSNRRDMGFWRKWHQVLAYRLFNRWVNKIIAVTNSVKEMIIENENVPFEKIEVIYNGVEFSHKPVDIRQQRSQLKISEQDIVIMHVANLRPIKGHVYLIEAFAKIAPRFSNAKLVLIGKDELNGELQNLAQKLGVIDQILFLGQRSDVSTLLAIADICVLPSLSEGMSNAILEYMAFGMPVIATKVGGNPELIEDGFNGLLVDKENVPQLAEVMIKLLEDKAKRQLMGKNGLVLVQKKFSMEAMLGQYKKLFQIKVLHLVSSGGLFGAEQVMLTLAGSTDGITHVIGALNNQHNPHLEIIEEAQKRGFNTAVFESKGPFDFSTIGHVAKYVLQNNINIIHTHNYKSNLIGAWAARKSRKKWIATIHGWIGTDAKLRWYEKIDGFILKFAHQVVCVSDANYQSLLGRGFMSAKLTVIANGIDLKRFSQGQSNIQLKQELGVENKIVLTIVGRLAPEKGHEILFKAMTQVIKQNSNVKLLVIGDGPLKNTLEEQTKVLGLFDYVVLAGLRKDMPDIYGICDILINASFTEGLPMTILEAMAARLPVIATDVGGVGKVIKNQENGMLLQAGNPEALAGAIIELAGDEKMRQRFAQKAYQDACDRFSDARMAVQYQEIYINI